jgi:DNA-directed RNA polymerase subunit RPC12/RpoP
MSQRSSQSLEEDKASSFSSRSSEDQEYRMVRKGYMCHMCEREFKHMVPVNELVEVECPRCNQTFVEEI